MIHDVVVGPLPRWLPANQLLGDGAWSFEAGVDDIRASAKLPTAVAADIAARLRAVTLAGKRIEVTVTPALLRSAVRAGRLTEARRQRDRSPGFTRTGVQLDAQTKLGLTPEHLALQLGERAKRSHVIDTCCGAGGNAIGFARAGCSVTAIEIDAARLAMAKHNAAVYGVSNKIEWLHGDARRLLPTVRSPRDALWFVDVPWQGAPEPSADTETADDVMHSLLNDILALRAPGQTAWAKVPAAFDPARVDGAVAVAYFGTAGGDACRVKFLVLEFTAQSEPDHATRTEG